MNIPNLTIMFVFIIMAIWLGVLLVRMKRTVIIYGKFLTMTKIMFIVSLGFALATMILFGNNIGELIRSMVMSLVILMFICLQDGLTEDGFFYTGSEISFSDVVDFDYKESKDKLSVYFTYRDPKQKAGVVYREIVFPPNRAQVVEQHLNSKIAKKRKRMKK